MALNSDLLRPDTREVWERVHALRGLGGFILIGGTALTLRIGHRLSEDLDFAWPALRLPRVRIDALRRAFAETGVDLIANDDPAAVEEFIDAGLDLLDYQQDYLANGRVKVTFWAPDPEQARLLDPVAPAGLRVAELDEIFRMKCLVCADRSKTRDWFDLHTLVRDHGFGPGPFIDAFERAGAPSKLPIALSRLCSGRPSVQDEAYESLLRDPPTPARMTAFFKGFRDDVEREAAARAMRRTSGVRRGPEHA